MFVYELIDRLLGELPLGTELNRILTQVNAAQRTFAQKHPWELYKTTGTILLIEPYVVGTVDVTEGDATVTGTGTTFTSAMVGRKFRPDGDSVTYTFTTFTSTTEFELDRVYDGDTDTDKDYSIFEDTYDLPTDLKRLKRVMNLNTTRPMDEITMRQYLGGRPFGNNRSFFLWRSNTIVRSNTYVLYGINSTTGAREIIFTQSPVEADTVEIWYSRTTTDVTGPASELDIPDGAEDALVYDLMSRYLGRTQNQDEAIVNRIRTVRGDAKREIRELWSSEVAQSNAEHRSQRVML